ncbi:MAG TPA: hypothetical protein PK961_04290 [bacterium]|nr:hypothetical protein [bacterium]
MLKHSLIVWGLIVVFLLMFSPVLSAEEANPSTPTAIKKKAEETKPEEAAEPVEPAVEESELSKLQAKEKEFLLAEINAAQKELDAAKELLSEMEKKYIAAPDDATKKSRDLAKELVGEKKKALEKNKEKLAELIAKLKEDEKAAKEKEKIALATTAFEEASKAEAEAQKAFDEAQKALHADNTNATLQSTYFEKLQALEEAKDKTLAAEIALKALTKATEAKAVTHSKNDPLNAGDDGYQIVTYLFDSFPWYLNRSMTKCLRKNCLKTCDNYRIWYEQKSKFDLFMQFDGLLTQYAQENFNYSVDDQINIPDSSQYTNLRAYLIEKIIIDNEAEKLAEELQKNKKNPNEQLKRSQLLERVQQSQESKISASEGRALSIKISDALHYFLSAENLVEPLCGPQVTIPFADSNSNLVIVVYKRGEIQLDVRQAISKVTMKTSKDEDKVTQVWDRGMRNYKKPYISLNLMAMHELVPQDSVSFQYYGPDNLPYVYHDSIKRTDVTQLYSTGSVESGFWFPIGLFGIFYEESDEGLPISLQPVNLAWGAKFYVDPKRSSKYIGVSAVVGWAIATVEIKEDEESKEDYEQSTSQDVSDDGDDDEDERFESTLTNFSVGGMIDVNNYMSIGAGHMWNPVKSVDDRGWFIIIGFHPDYLGKVPHP